MFNYTVHGSYRRPYSKDNTHQTGTKDTISDNNLTRQRNEHTKLNKYTTHGDTYFQRSVVYWDALMIGKSNLEMNQRRLQCWDASSEPEGPLLSLKLLFPGRASKWYFETACLAEVTDLQRHASCSLLSEMPQDATGYNVISKMLSLEGRATKE